MQVGSATAYDSTLVQTLQRTPEAAEVQKVGRDNDGDADDRGGQAAQPQAGSTVDFNGKPIGTTLNVTA